MKSVLTVEALHIRYGSIEALKGISLTVDEGEIVTVLGANGAGKSTLLNSVCGLLPVHSGSILIAGESIGGLPAYQLVLKGVSQTPEGRKVFATLSVDENLNLGAYLRRRDRAQVQSAKERVFETFPILKSRRKQLAGTLSGGEQQMLAMGRALMSSPRILLLDEPSLGLAPILVQQIFDIIRDINKQGVSILLVEQNAHKALSIAGRGYVLETGCIAAEGTSGELKSDRKIQEAYLGGAAFSK